MFAKRMIQLTLILVLLVASVAATHGVSAAGYCGNTYVVQRGDWLSKIANRCGVTLSQLYAANPYVGYYIYPGQVLNIPGWNGNSGPVPGYGGPVPGNGAPNPGNGGAWYGNGHYFCGPTSSSYYGKYYVVCRGDTLLKIALYYGERLSYLQWHNHIYNADRIFAGQFIFP
jgi:LysM repeat protein